MKRLTLKELMHMVDLNSCNIEFFEKLVVTDLSTFPDKEELNYSWYNPITFATVDDIQILAAGESTEHLRKDVGEKLFNKQEQDELQKPIMIHTTTCQFPLVTGS